MATVSIPSPIRKAEVYLFRAPLDVPFRTSFAVMHSRAVVLLRLEDADGHYGWGEAWSTFPPCGAEHRYNLLETIIAPLLLGQTFASPQDGYDMLAQRTQVVRLQADEPGPLDQIISCADIALWDLAARRAGIPLYAALGGTSGGTVKTYASGVNHPGIAETFATARAKGYCRFKIKFAFGEKQDFQNLNDAYKGMEKGEELAVDANQGWDLATALDQVRKLQDYPLFWIEEPLRCNRPLEEWKELASISRIPLAAGENLRNRESFSAAIASGALGVVQPDICKWGGLSVCKEVAAEVLRTGRRYCPHFLGSGVGLLASAHLLAASGGDGLLEVDCTPSPMRELLAQPFPAVTGGNLRLPETPGLGADPNLEGAKQYLTQYKAVS